MLATKTLGPVPQASANLDASSGDAGGDANVAGDLVLPKRLCRILRSLLKRVEALPASSRPWTTWFTGADEPTFHTQESWQAIMVRDLMCPIVSPRSAMSCCGYVSAVSATRATCVEPFVDNQFDFALWRPSSPSPIKRATID